MKKIIAAFLAGILVMVSGQVLADGISKIGKKVGSEATVLLDKTELSDAIIIEGKSYLPVRDIAEAFGADVEYIPATKTDKAVIELTTVIQSTDGSSILPSHQLVILKQKKESLIEELGHLDGAIFFQEEKLKEAKSDLEGSVPWMEELFEKRIAEYSDMIKVTNSRISELKKEIEEIEKAIKELESAE